MNNQRKKWVFNRLKSSLSSFSVASSRFSIIHIDLVGPLSVSGEYRYSLYLIDSTKSCWLYLIFWPSRHDDIRTGVKIWVSFLAQPHHELCTWILWKIKSSLKWYITNTHSCALVFPGVLISMRNCGKEILSQN